MEEAKHCLRAFQIAKPAGKQCPDLAVLLNPVSGGVPLLAGEGHEIWRRPDTVCGLAKSQKPTGKQCPDLAVLLNPVSGGVPLLAGEGHEIWRRPIAVRGLTKSQSPPASSVPTWP
jgi:hypothetical protein